MAKKTHVQLACNGGLFQTRLGEVFELKGKTSSDIGNRGIKPLFAGVFNF